MRLTKLLAAPLFATSLFMTGCIGVDLDHGSSDKYQEDFHFSYDLQPNGQLVAETFNLKTAVNRKAELFVGCHRGSFL